VRAWNSLWAESLYFWGPKNQSFWNKSGKLQPTRTKFGIRGQVKGCQRSGNFGAIGPFGQNWGWDDILVESRDFLIHSLLQDNPLRKTIANIFAIFSTTDYHVV